jgi:quinol monooxygenase YgiN
MMLATIRMAIPRQKRGETLRVLKSMAEQFGDEPGCLSCRVYQDLQQASALVFEEIWKTKEELEHHVRSAGYQTLLVLMESSSQPPEIVFSTLSEEEGMKVIERIRTVKGGCSAE